jgi:hypothetical protein
MVYIDLVRIVAIWTSFLLTASLHRHVHISYLAKHLYADKLVDDGYIQQQSLTKSLNSLKNAGKLPKFASSIAFAKPMSSKEFYQVSRISFSSSSYYDEVIRSMDINQKQNQLISIYILTSIISILSASIVFPLINMPVDIKNALSLFCLSYPFIGALICFSFPDIVFKLIAYIQNYGRRNKLEDERILYHEAGHILVGYLSGVAVNSYVIDGDIASHAAVDIDEDYFTATLNDIDQKTKPPKLGISNLILLAMAGVVAETLRYGDSKGGEQDLLVAKSLLASINVSTDEITGYLRWAIAKALVLLRLNRNALDELVMAIKQNEDIQECYQIIEKTVEIRVDGINLADNA